MGEIFLEILLYLGAIILLIGIFVFFLGFKAENIDKQFHGMGIIIVGEVIALFSTWLRSMIA